MDLLKSLLGSKKFVAMLVGVIVVIVGKAGFDVDQTTIAEIVGLIVAFIVGQGVADAGKEKAKIEAKQ